MVKASIAKKSDRVDVCGHRSFWGQASALLQVTRAFPAAAEFCGPYYQSRNEPDFGHLNLTEQYGGDGALVAHAASGLGRLGSGLPLRVVTKQPVFQRNGRLIISEHILRRRRCSTHFVTIR
jgi:hypothetical protein